MNAFNSTRQKAMRRTAAFAHLCLTVVVLLPGVWHVCPNHVSWQGQTSQDQTNAEHQALHTRPSCHERSSGPTHTTPVAPAAASTSGHKSGPTPASNCTCSASPCHSAGNAAPLLALTLQPDRNWTVVQGRANSDWTPLRIPYFIPFSHAPPLSLVL